LPLRLWLARHDAVLEECEKEVTPQHSAEWGPLDRRS